MTIWYTSDWHFGHVNIMDYCPARRYYLDLSGSSTVTDMNEALVALWNSQVHPDDTVKIIGDFAMGKVEETLEYARRLNGIKLLIAGNHDRVHPCATRKEEKRQYWINRYDEVGLVIPDWNTFEFHEHYVAGRVRVSVSHFPYTGDHSDEIRYGEWRPQDHGQPLIHGHVHDMWQTRGREYNVGIDAWDGQMQAADTIADYFEGLD